MVQKAILHRMCLQILRRRCVLKQAKECSDNKDSYLLKVVTGP